MNNKLTLLISFLIFIYFSVPAFSQDKIGENTATPTPGPTVAIEENTHRHTSYAKFFDRNIFELRATVNGKTPARRAIEFTNNAIELSKKNPDRVKVTAEKCSFGYIINIDKVPVLTISHSDFTTQDPDIKNEQLEHLMSTLETAISDYKEHNNFKYITSALLTLLFAILVLFIVRRLIHFLGNLSKKHIFSFIERTFRKFANNDFSAQYAPTISTYIHSIINAIFYSSYIFLFYIFLTLILRNIPYTRPWSSELLNYLLNGTNFLYNSLILILPNILTIIAILIIAKYSVQLIGIIFNGISKNQIRLPFIDKDTLVPSSRLLSVFIWIIAIGLIYPFIPGSGTDAFKSLSVLIGVMVSLGSTNIIAQAFSGLILTYTKSMKVGDWVRIKDNEGEVLSMGAFTVQIITIHKEEISLPNSVVLDNATINYTKQKNTQGVAIYTNVTIGYDIPKELVEELLFEAARKTNSTLQNGKATVWITNFNNYAVEYKLTVWVNTPHIKGGILSELNGNIFEVFKENKVELMTPSIIDVKNK